MDEVIRKVLRGKGVGASVQTLFLYLDKQPPNTAHAFGHSYNTAVIATKEAAKRGLAGRELEDVFLGGLYHDLIRGPGSIDGTKFKSESAKMAASLLEKKLGKERAQKIGRILSMEPYHPMITGREKTAMIAIGLADLAELNPYRAFAMGYSNPEINKMLDSPAKRRAAFEKLVEVKKKKLGLIGAAPGDVKQFEKMANKDAIMMDEEFNKKMGEAQSNTTLGRLGAIREEVRTTEAIGDIAEAIPSLIRKTSSWRAGLHANPDFPKWVDETKNLKGVPLRWLPKQSKISKSRAALRRKS